jgi:hypothetical protein
MCVRKQSGQLVAASIAALAASINRRAQDSLPKTANTRPPDKSNAVQLS